MLLARRDFCYDTCLVDHQRRFVYAYIPKAACTSIKTWLVRSAGFAPEFALRLDRAEAEGLSPSDENYPRVHAYVEDHCSLKHQSRGRALEALSAPSYFKFAFVRNPLSRLVSVYLDKVVGVKRPAWRIIRNHQVRQLRLGFTALNNWAAGGPLLDAGRSLTFREFVDQLGRENQERLDPHFRAQTRLLRGLPLDFIGRVENMREDFAVVQSRLGVNAPLVVQHAQKYHDNGTDSGIADWPAAEFRSRSGAPRWPRFYDAMLLKKVQSLFADDFKRFGYECSLAAAEHSKAA